MLRTAFAAGGGLLRGATRAVFGGAASSNSSGRPLTTSRPAAAPEVLGNTDTERAIAEKIAGGLTGATSVRVEDTSGGCGTMYAIEVTASDFDGRSKIKQHQLVTKLISDDVKQWHGFQLVTKTP